ncbi:MAG: hypothetical protein ABI555_10070 [Chloroflexota bacterium]
MAVLAMSEAALGLAQDLSRGGDGDPLRVAISLLLAETAFAAVAVALRMAWMMDRSPDSSGWPSIALAVAATLFAVAGAMIVVGRITDWWPGELLGVVNLPGMLLLAAAWIAVARTSHRRHGSTWRGFLPSSLAGLGMMLPPLAVIGGPLQILAQTLFVAGWLLMARLIWSGRDVTSEGVPAR